ncbi:MAG: hypothetical protein A3B74_01405 [Candidatus Kerfeldbacteria bacterium RIFCSPHIGHO2_02_FULL_42_14]|uniref:Uncharacterized protein n=1 Tax=Candidatus Kerfeldbacteria bacterium RIFCSPHIGHO2_02_FULL_42_14 TaxID=1798540 RepID=A0A1G2ARI4_9BACT|nr:MAG: hypothetical protein A3B74_01405 [Candidatus Kerfeldbacteria bacterium RIFCSPHIGHO2_02_FULL_42_14]OGY81216.1 MAG: hypothetical protein A3E60_02920 [Candidatus Kerfeldbacteria bacterium RIFCSPHIGHO2_12_FULL_42_13]OGY83364.1 MAG: hypothetical protein A3I91_01790 [Candidatus Kerfeldbacteria bacterium RIFCSPLOWO2_02_FULL_42_19]OGY86374.1 MAG: hypothetical protein A3G01_05250 [Candidatus Kerfeldbacteria bacterium RIFCSPLOWO2_12_FULL_43_9]
MIIIKEEEDSRFRSTDTAQCAEKGESISSFALCIVTETVFGDSPLESNKKQNCTHSVFLFRIDSD